MPIEEERRAEPRHRRDERVLVKIIACGEQPALVGTIARCATEDLSTEGLRLRVARAVPEGASLDLWVKVHEWPGTYYLSGEVIWARDDPDREDGCIAGIQVLDQAGSDAAAWREATQQLGARPPPA